MHELIHAKQLSRAFLFLAATASVCAAQPTDGDDGGAESGLPPVATQPADGDIGALGGQLTVDVGRYEFDGNTVFPDEELAKVVAPFTGPGKNTQDLEEARRAVTRYYIENGYINSGAVLPDQTVEGGVIKLQVVEGTLTDINLQNPGGRLNDQYLLTRVRRGAASPLNIVRLRNELEIIRQNPNLRRISAELRPGTEPGESYLDVQVEETNPVQLGLQFSNNRSPSVGSEQLDVLASHRNLTGNADVLALRYGLLKGGFEDLEFSEFDDFSIDYTIPISPSDTTLSVAFTRTDSLVVEDPFEDLEITSETNSIGVSLRQPVWRRPTKEFALFVSGVYRDNQTFLLGEPFSFAPGAEDGESSVSILRLGQEYTERSQQHALAVRSTFSIGTNAFDATDSGEDNIPDGQYFAWLGQAQYVRRLPQLRVNDAGDSQFVFRVSSQLTTDPLLAIEQFAIGGVDTVRGYRENQVVRDNAVVGSLELHVPVLSNGSGMPVLEVVPFFDVGYGWNQNGYDPDAGITTKSQVLYSVGVGLRFTPNRHVDAQIFYGYALRDPEIKENDDLQDAGIHFNLLLLAF